MDDTDKTKPGRSECISLLSGPARAALFSWSHAILCEELEVILSEVMRQVHLDVDRIDMLWDVATAATRELDVYWTVQNKYCHHRSENDRPIFEQQQCLNAFARAVVRYELKISWKLIPHFPCLRMTSHVSIEWNTCSSSLNGLHLFIEAFLCFPLLALPLSRSASSTPSRHTTALLLLTRFETTLCGLGKAAVVLGLPTPQNCTRSMQEAVHGAALPTPRPLFLD